MSLLCSLLACLFLAGTFYLFLAFGREVYFAQFHRPLNTALFTKTSPSRAQATLPHLTLTASIGAQSLSPGDTQSMNVTTKTDQTTTGYLEVWITSPNHREVYKNTFDQNHPLQFIANASITQTFSYKLGVNIPKGAYSVSALVTSNTFQTDYAVDENFATFTVL